MEQAAFKQHALLQRRFLRAVHAFLDHHGRDHGFLDDLRGGLHRLFNQGLRRDDPADQTTAFSLGGLHETAGQMHVHRLGLAHGAGQALGAAKARNDAKVDFGLAELGSIGSDDEIAHHRQFAATAQTIARDSRDDRLAYTLDSGDFRSEHVIEEDVDECLLGHLAHVCPGGEGLF